MCTQEQWGELALYIQENYSDPVLIDAGADILNDISALEDDERLASFAAEKKIPVIYL